MQRVGHVQFCLISALPHFRSPSLTDLLLEPNLVLERTFCEPWFLPPLFSFVSPYSSFSSMKCVWVWACVSFSSSFIVFLVFVLLSRLLLMILSLLYAFFSSSESFSFSASLPSSTYMYAANVTMSSANRDSAAEFEESLIS